MKLYPQMTFRVAADLKAEVEALAKSDGVTSSKLIVRALERYMQIRNPSQSQDATHKQETAS